MIIMALAHTALVTRVGHSLSLGSGRYHFRELISFKMALSSICSASSLFSLPFSPSKALGLRVSETSIPPNFAFAFGLEPMAPSKAHYL